MPTERVCSFRCAYDDSDEAALVLARYQFVRVLGYSGGALRFELDLTHPALGRLDGAVAELKIIRALEKALSLHTPPPPKDAA